LIAILRVVMPRGRHGALHLPVTFAMILRYGIAPAPRRGSPSWAEFLRARAGAIIACGFVTVFTVDLLDGTKAYVLAVIERATRRIHILGATARPIALWVTQQARNMLMDLEGTVGQVRFLIRDRDVLYPPGFNQVLADAGIETVRGAVRAPRMNSIMERWIGGARRGLLDRTLVWSLPHLGHILREYETHHNGHEPHLTLAGAAPDRPLPPEVADLQAFRTRRHDRVGGITHEYQQAT
jgi:transposase InsO family protein